jgi:thioredoxin-dependent peroxiredoxin
MREGRGGRGLPSPVEAGYGWTMRTPALAVLLLLGAATVAPGALFAPGDPFPAWTLRDQSGASVSSRDLAGKTYLLWFYPKAQTPGCTMEGLSLKNKYDEFQRRHVEVLGVSLDPPAANAAFVEAQGFPFRLLSDADRTLATAAGAVRGPEQPVASRISYLVGPDGKVLRVYPDVDPATHATTVLRDVPGSGTAE